MGPQDREYLLGLRSLEDNGLALIVQQIAHEIFLEVIELSPAFPY